MNISTIKNKKIAFFDLIDPNFVGGRQKIFCEYAKHYRDQHNNVWYVGNNRFYHRILLVILKFVAVIDSIIRHQKLTIKEKYCSKKLPGIHMHSTKAGIFFPFTPSYFALRKLLLSADIIYSNNEFPDLMTLYILVGTKGFRKTIVGMHTAIFLPKISTLWLKIHNLFYLGCIYKFLLKKVSAIHITNKGDKILLQKMLHIPFAKIHYIPDRLPLIWEKENIRKVNPSKLFSIIFMGRLSFQKGIDLLSKIIERMKQDNLFNECTLTIVGPPAEYHGPIVSSMKGIRNINYIEYSNDMKSLYRQHDIAIVTSRWETFGYNVLEPQSQGLPVVAFDVHGPSDIIENKETGYLVKKFDLTKFYECILKLKKMRQKNLSEFLLLGKRAYQRTRQLFTYKMTYQKLDQLFNKLSKNS